LIAECNKIINEEDYRNQVLINKITDLKNKYGDERRTKLLNIEEEKIKKEKVEIIPEDCVIVVSKAGLIKRVPSQNYRTQKRNGTGVKNEDVAEFICKTNTVDTILIFSSKGKMYRLPAINIPEGTNGTKGVPISSLVSFEVKEVPMAFASLTEGKNPKYVLFGTKNGTIKKVPFEEYNKTKKTTGVKALTLRPDDSLVSVTFMDDEELLLVTKEGMAIRFKTADMPISSRTAMGIKGIKLNEGDNLLACIPIKEQYLAIVTTSGKGKFVSFDEFVCQGRGGKGVKCSMAENVAAAIQANGKSDILIIGDKNSIRVSASDFPVISRMASGNHIIKNSNVVSIAQV
jgi:DNA gyrase subunit A